MEKYRHQESYPSPTVFTWGSLDGPTVTDYPFPPVALPTVDERIVYESGPFGTNKNCWHDKWQHEWLPGPMYGEVLPWRSWCRVQNPAATLWSILGPEQFANLAWPGQQLPDPECDWGSLSFDALDAMSPSMRQDVSLSNFLWELGDVRRMFSLWDKHSGLIKNAAGANLNWNFGWKPFLSDLKKIVEGMASFEERLAELVAKEGAPNRRHFTRTTNPPSTVWEYEFNSGTTVIYAKRVTSYKYAKFCATMDYRYTLPCMGNRERKIRALLDTLGLTLNPSQILEAIPWSFVVDWFVNVQGVLQQFDKNMLNPALTIIGYMHSLKYEATEVVSYKVFGSEANAWCEVAKHSVKSYARWRGIPKTTKDVEGTLSFFGNLHKVGLATSLLLTR